MKRGKPIYVSTQIMLASLKLPNQLNELVGRIGALMTEVSDLVNGEWKGISRKNLGLVLRKWGERPAGNDWLLGVIMAMVKDMIEKDKKPSEGIYYLSLRFQSKNNAIHQTYNAYLVLTLYSSFLDHIESLDLLDVHTLKPILDGNTLCKELNIKPGRGLGDILQTLVEWQLENPEATKEEALDAVKTLSVSSKKQRTE